MKIKILKSLQEIKFDPDKLDSGKTIVLRDLSYMEHEHGLAEICLRPYFIYLKSELMWSVLNYLRVLQRKKYIAIDRRWEDAELEHPALKARLEILKWYGEILEESAPKDFGVRLKVAQNEV